MSCPECNGSCCGETWFSDYGLDVDIGYRAKDCKIDDQDPWWVEVVIDSTRGSKHGSTSIVEVEGELLARREIEVLKDQDSVRVPGNSNDNLLEFKIKQKSNTHPPKREDLKLELEMSEQGPFQESETLQFQRTLSLSP